MIDYKPPGKTAATGTMLREDFELQPMVWFDRRLWPWLEFGGLRGFHLTRHKLAIRNLPVPLAGLRIVHVTDTHIKRKWCKGHGELIERLNTDPPDLILFTGDFVDDIVDSRSAYLNLERFCRSLRSRLGTFALTGNHDGDLLGARMESLGVTLLNERSATLRIDDAEIELIGLPGVRRRNFEPGSINALPPRRAGVPRIVLAHFPDQILLIQPLAADLMLSGHTHGGQICLPNGRAMLTHDGLPMTFAQGRWQVGATELIVNRGLGWTRWPIRIFCPAEVVEIKFERQIQDTD